MKRRGDDAVIGAQLAQAGLAVGVSLLEGEAGHHLGTSFTSHINSSLDSDAVSDLS